ncbi:hypothetical protein J2S13_001938 [Oikeobacillus pervagus]|uniref:Uncharacterized protein n=1 Tax=Oikeobacillus pervagus TaxID=1325931 RepID=A0AAJ1WJB9_9BACI|nr:hypothetical protein [Oikeobacillus pervagus]MDQ0215520.1 hypothetical protein [Oikeobacillus pervagus]
MSEKNVKKQEKVESSQKETLEEQQKRWNTFWWGTPRKEAEVDSKEENRKGIRWI